MLTYSFENLTTTLYEHLYQCVKNDILAGVLPAGTKLPSKRSFAKNLGISVITVENSYAQLVAEGYIYSAPKKGYYVTDIKTLNPTTTPKPANEDTILTIPSKPVYYADFASNQTRSKNFPFSIWSRLVRELLSNHQKDLMTNSPCGGILHLREAIANHLGDYHGIAVSPEQIVVGAGTEYLYGLLIQLLGSSRTYAVEDPGYSKIARIYHSHQVRCEYIGMDADGIRIQDLNHQNVDVVHLSPSHHFPTGIVMPIRRRYELLAWANQSDSHYIIEDDYDSEFRLSGQPIPTLQSIDTMEKVIYMNTFTKTLASTVRISYMVLPRHLVRQFYKHLSFYSCTVSTFEQHTLAEFIDGGYFEKHLNRMRNYYRNKRDSLLTCIEKSPIAPYVQITAEDAGLHFLLKIQMDYEDDTFCKRAIEHGIHLLPLSHFYQQEPVRVSHIFVINYSSLPDERMEEAIQRLYHTIIE